MAHYNYSELGNNTLQIPTINNLTISYMGAISSDSSALKTNRLLPKISILAPTDIR